MDAFLCSLHKPRTWLRHSLLPGGHCAMKMLQFCWTWLFVGSVSSFLKFPSFSSGQFEGRTSVNGFESKLWLYK